MKNVRIGNDINIVWQFLNNGQPFNLEGKDVTIYLSCTYERVKVKEFSISENTITWVFKGKEQKYVGKYSLELVLNEGKDGMATTDARKFVNLVHHCCNNEGFDEPNFTTTTISLESNVVYMAAAVDEELSEESSNAISNRAVTIALKDKQDIISDLNEIRENAAKGATALQPEDAASNIYVTEFSVVDLIGSVFDSNGELLVNKAPLVDAILNNKILVIPVNPYHAEGGGAIADVMRFADGFEASVCALGGQYVDFACYFDFPNGTEDKLTIMVTDYYRVQQRIEDLDAIREGASKGATAIQKVKTINGQSIEGEGDIVIEGGSGEANTEALEKVVAAALTDLDERMKQMDAKIEESIIGVLNTEV